MPRPRRQAPGAPQGARRLWHYEAGRHFGLPLDDRTALEVLLTPRPQMASPRDRYIYYPGTLEVPEAVAVNIRGRSYKIAAEVELTTSAAGVLFAHGAMFGGHALYIKDGKLKYVYNYLGEKEQVVVSDEPISGGQARARRRVHQGQRDPDGHARHPHTVHRRRAVGELKNVKTQLGKFSLCGEGLNIGRDGGAPVTEDYPGERPWAIRGDDQRVIVDVSGEAYVDLEKEAMAMMSATRQPARRLDRRPLPRIHERDCVQCYERDGTCPLRDLW